VKGEKEKKGERKRQEAGVRDRKSERGRGELKYESFIYCS